MPNGEYKDIPSGILDWLVSTDERIDAVHKKLLSVAEGVGTIKNMIAALPGAVEVPVLRKVTKQVKFKETLAPLGGLEVDARCPLEGEIISVMANCHINKSSAV